MPSLRPILFVTRNFPPTRGGIETMAKELAGHAAAQGEPWMLLHIGQPPLQSSGKGPNEGFTRYVHAPGTGKWPALLAALIWIPWLVLRYRVRLIVNMQVTTAPGSWLSARLFGVRYIVIGLGLEVMPGGGRFWRWLRGLALRGASKVISISRFTDSLVAGFGVGHAARKVILPGTRAFAPEEMARDREAVFGPGSSDAFVCLSLARLVPRKGMDTMLEALAHIRKSRPDILYCIAGMGPDRARLEALVSEKGLEKHVRFLGRVADADLGSVYARADLFVLMSRTSEDPPDAEGFGIVFLEAAMCGTPSIGGNSGGIPDAIVDGETGYLVDPGDPAALARRILDLMGDRSKLRRLGGQARERAQGQTWDKACERYLAAIMGRE